MKYYSLKYGGNVWRNRELDLIVGQCEDADLRLPSDPDREDEDYFVIRYLADTDGWCIVSLSDNIGIRCDGVELALASELRDGSVIEVEGEIVKFSLHGDSSYKYTEGIEMMPRRIKRYFLAFGIAILLLSGAIFAFAKIQFREKDVIDWKLPERMLSSVRKIQADSLFIQSRHNGEYVNIDSLALISSGTCFVLSDGTLVTARHCIQPWLQYDLKDTLDMDAVTSRIMTVETSRALGVDTTMRAVVKLEVDGRVYYSSDFSFDTDRDIVFNAGTRNNVRMWRSLRPVFHHVDCELGDIAWLKDCGLEGNLEIASERHLSCLNEESDIAIIGFPEGDDGMNVRVKIPGYILNVSHNPDGSVNRCLHHMDKSSRGVSGAPVIIRRNGRYFVVSVLSRKDRNGESSWSVPISEMRYER